MPYILEESLFTSNIYLADSIHLSLNHLRVIKLSSWPQLKNCQKCNIFGIIYFLLCRSSKQWT